NPGNSGGALVNLNGQLVGINTASFNLQGSMAGNIGLGFAIPSDLANGVMQQLLANGGVVRRGTLGIETQDVDERIAKSLGLDTARGAAVTRVYPESAGKTAGLEPGDVIVAANGQRIENGEMLRNFQCLQPATATASRSSGLPPRARSRMNWKARTGTRACPARASPNCPKPRAAAG